MRASSLRHLLAQLAAAALALAGPGCAMTASKATELAQPAEPEVEKENLARLVEFLTKDGAEDPRDDITRAVAMRSAVELVLRTRAKETAPETYRAVAGAIQTEAVAPKVSARSAQPDEDRRYLRAAAAQALGALHDPEHVPFFVELAGARENLADPEKRVEVAVFSALHDQLSVVQAQVALRSQLLARLNEAAWRGPGASGPAVERVDRLAAALYGRLRSLPALTELLVAYEGQPPSEQALLDALARDNELLRDALEQRRDLPPEAFQANVDALVRYQRSKQERVARRATAILLESAPYALFRDLLDRAARAPRSSREELERIARMLPSIDALAADHARTPVAGAGEMREGKMRLNEQAWLERKPFPELRRTALACMFDLLAGVDARAREVLYSELLGYAPLELTEFLVKRAQATLGEPPAEALQYVRFLGNLLADPAVRASAPSPGEGKPLPEPLRPQALRASAVAAVAGIAAYPAVETRALVASYLLEGETLALARAVAPVMDRLESLAPEQAQDVLALAIACATRLKEPPGKPDAVLGARSFARAIARTEQPVREAAVRYVHDRAPDVAARLLAAQVSALAPRQTGVDLHLLTLLGDVLVAGKGKLPQDAVEAGVKALAAALPNLDEERALHACRYIADAGAPSSKAALAAYERTPACAWPTVKTLISVEVQ